MIFLLAGSNMNGIVCEFILSCRRVAHLCFYHQWFATCYKKQSPLILQGFVSKNFNNLTRIIYLTVQYHFFMSLYKAIL